MIKKSKNLPKRLQSFSEATINSLIKQIQTSTGRDNHLNAKVKRTYVDPSLIGPS